MQQRDTQTAELAQRRYKILILFLFVGAMIVIFLFTMLRIVLKERDMPSKFSTTYDRAFRGSILSADGYKLSTSRKSYMAAVRGASIVPERREVFIKLFSIYSGIPEAKIRNKLKSKDGTYNPNYIIITDTLDFQVASQLKSLAYKLRKLGVFRAIKLHSGVEKLFALDIIEVGEARIYPKHDVLTPILGFTKAIQEKHYSRPVAKGGLEKYYDTYLKSRRDGKIQGKHDVVGSLIYNGELTEVKRFDGLDLQLNIPLSLQCRIEKMIDMKRQELGAREVLVGVMESHTGKLLTLATTKRYDPGFKKSSDLPALVAHFTEYAYEAGSVLKPLTLAIALDLQKVTPTTSFKTGYKRFDIGHNNYIHDDEFFERLTATDIIVHSSNIGISKIAWRLTGKQFFQGITKFGLGKKTGIDLSRELVGKIKPPNELNKKLDRANAAYGYGISVTFMQLLRAYSAFNNGGITVTPMIAHLLHNTITDQYHTPKPKVPSRRVIHATTAHKMHKILTQVVNSGTGKRAAYPGLEIGGKTGTAQIAQGGSYLHEYHSSFFGFANDDRGHRYTIGVLVIRPQYESHFASQSAVPTFRNIVDILVKQGYLIPENTTSSPTKQTKAKTKTTTPAPPKRSDDTKSYINHSPHELFEELL